ncbi:MAG: CPBP family intramembrane metalloprotease [Clostridia bacterium]|nr:CPBP family intramembrane metalloprotease [Clostridia bacterium]
MKNEKLMSLAAVFGWFGAYLFISTIAVRLPEGVDCAVTVLALWGLIFVCARSFEDKKTIPEMLAHGGIRKVKASVLLFAFIAGAGLNLAYSGLLSLLPIPEEIVESYIDASAKYEEPSNALMFKAVFLVPVLEETVFRGLIGDRLSRFAPKWIAIPAASLIFAVMHGDLLWCTYAFISGIALTWLYFRCKSILPCISFHLAFNAANYIWAKILHLPDEVWAYAVSLIIGITIFISFIVVCGIKTKE